MPSASNGAAGLAFFWMMVPALFTPLYGMYIDRIMRKPLLVWGNVISALMVLPLLVVREAGDVWIVYVVAFLYGVSFVVLPAGLNGLLKEMIPDGLLVEVNSSLQTTKEGFRLIGPLVGAALFGMFGGGVVAVVDSLSFLVAALIITSIPLQESLPARSEQHWWREMTEGVRHLAREPVLRNTLVAFAQCRTPHALMGRVSAAVETLMGAPQSASLALVPLLVTLVDHHVLFAIMAGFTGAAVVYLLLA